MTDVRLRVIKVGGSLLDHPSFVGTLTDWLQNQPPMANVLVTGGGVWADEVRHLDRTRTLSSESAHWLAVRAMKLTACLLCQLLPRATMTDRFETVLKPFHESRANHHPVIFECERFLRQVEPHLPRQPLPHGWQVTSDSIAARLAEVTDAEELVLLKSTGPSASTPQQAANVGTVDAYFPQAAAPLRRVHWVNLRDPTRAPVCWGVRS